MAVGMKDPVLGPPVMRAVAKAIRNCPPLYEVAEGGHFVQRGRFRSRVLTRIDSDCRVGSRSSNASPALDWAGAPIPADDPDLSPAADPVLGPPVMDRCRPPRRDARSGRLLGRSDKPRRAMFAIGGAHAMQSCASPFR
jgi:hypothetical protein